MSSSSKHFGLSAVKLALAVREFRTTTADPDLAHAEPLAVVGMACRFPGGADSPQAYWSLLRNGVDAITEVPRDRWDIDAYYDEDARAPGKMNTRSGGFLRERVDLFDPGFFGIAPREATSMDPQQRLLLEVAWEALEDAGLVQEQLAGSQTGVFFSIYSNDYGQQLFSEREAIDAYATLGTAHCIAAGRLSFLLDLRGPSLVVDTACSSSLVAVHLACQSLRAGESRVALAGGVSLVLTPDRGISLSKWDFMAPDGRCKVFDERADGWVRGEGAGVVVLKTLANALADRDRILAVVRGSAVNQDGRSSVLTAPNGMAQQDVIRAALASGRVAPHEVSFIEAHGTGTSIGDPIELEALAEVYGRPEEGRPCFVGGVKSNIGHLEAGAGIAGFMKVVLSLQHDAIPASLHFHRLNPHVSLDGTRMRVASEHLAWTSAEARRLASVSAFGFGGTNAHAVLEEAPPTQAPAAEPNDGRLYVLPLSARAPEAVRELADRYVQFLTDTHADGARTIDICHTAAVRRTHHDYRVSAIGSSRQELARALEAFVRKEARWDIVSGRRQHGRRPNPVFVFSGQGSQWWAMGRELLDGEPECRRVFEQIDALLRPQASWSLIDELRAAEADSRVHRTEVAQPAIFAVQMALTALLESWGIEPAAVVGHSVGEIAAARVAGVLDLESAVRVAYHRGRIMQDATGRGRMAALGLSLDEVAALLAPFGDRVSVAAVNAPRSITVSGEAGAIEQIVETVQGRGAFGRVLPVDYAFHSAQMSPFMPRLEQALTGLRTATPSVPLASTVSGAFAAAHDYDARYWPRNMREAVRFWPAIDVLLEAGHNAFLEIGPHPVLAPSLRQGLDGRVDDPLIVATLHRDRPSRTSLRAAAAALHAGGCVVDWARVLPQGGRVVALPSYAWQRQRYWAEVGDYRPEPSSAAAHLGSEYPGRALRSMRLSGSVFEAMVSEQSPAFVADHRVHDRVLFPAAAFLMMAARSVAAARAGIGARLKQVTILEPLVLEPGVVRTLQVLIDDTDGSRAITVASLADEHENRWRTHVSGEAVPSASAGDAAENLGDGVLESIRARCTETIDSSSWYDDLRAAGFAFGPKFRTIRAIARCEGEAIADVELPRGTASVGCAIHPVVLDGCVQAMWAAFPDRIRLATPRPAYVPVSVGAFCVHRDAPAQVRSHVMVTSVGEGDQTVTAHIRVYDQTGALILSADDVVLRRASREAIIRATERSVDDWLYEVVWTEAPRAARDVKGDATSPGVWIVLPDEHGVAARAEQILQSAGASVVRAEPTDSIDRLFETARALGELSGVLDCRTLNTAAAPTAGELIAAESQSLGGALALVQAMVKGGHVPSRGLSFVTRGAQPVDDELGAEGLVRAPLWGFARTIALEHPELQVRCMDLDSAAAEEDGGTLAAELLDGTDGEAHVAYRRGIRYTARLARMANPRLGDGQIGAVRLEIPQRGMLEKLTLQPLSRRAPAAGEVEIAIEASGVNFRDVLNTLGMYPGDAGLLGSECVGRIAAVGAGVDRFAIGDRVVAVGEGCLATHTTTRADFVARCPERLVSEAAATLPITFMTARYALENLAKIRPGDRVLIHAAAGGVGLAAVQLVQRAGGEVFATAVSPEKHAYLRSLGVTHVMSSRTLEFADRITALTGGRGVDIVLNSLAGDFIERSLSVLAPNGRFVEIGKTGIWNAETVAQKRPDVAYHTLYLGEVIDRDPALGRTLLQSVIDDVESGTLAPLPLRAFPIDASVRAFRFMAQARHIGKIVLTVPTASPDLALVPDGTYLVTGGLGALGLVVAEALASAGARHLILAGRRAPSPAVHDRIAALRARGVDVTVASADVSSEKDVAALVAAVPAAHPLRGVVHAAGVIDDGMVTQQSWERVERVLAPKMCGAWALHRATAPLSLDFFVMFSSVASILGSPGQSGYSAANAFMDGLAHVRRAEGLPALSINWGAWVDGGMASSLADADRRRWANQGVEAIEPARGAKVFIDLLATSRPQVTVLPISWAAFGEASGRTASLVADLVQEAAKSRSEGDGAAASSNQLRARLEAVAPGRRRPVLVSFVTEQAVKVLALPATYVLDAQQGLRDVGLDSLMAIELRNRLQEAVGQPLPATLAFDCPTVAALTDYLSTRVLQMPFGEPAADTTVDAGLQEIESLSDSEAEELLRQELALLNGRGRRGE